MFDPPIDPDGDPIIKLPPELDLERGLSIIEKGIRDLVKVLHEREFKVVCSCAGHTSFLPYPWLAFLLRDDNDQKLLLRLMKLLAIFNKAQGKNGAMPRSEDVWTLEPIIVEENVTVHLHSANLNNACTPETISRLRKQGRALAEFVAANF
jgi:hypothetical protein